MAIRVTAAIIRRPGEILLARRQQGSHLEGLWEFPGGKIEPGETPEQCLARELKEEFEVEAEVGKFITSHRHNYDDKEIELLAYEVFLESDDWTLNSHDEVQWVPLPELLQFDLAPADVPIAELLKDMSWTGLKKGDTADYKKINGTFRCSWSSGMNRGTKTNSLVLFSNHVKSIYHDRWLDTVLHYTGTGEKGDQVLDGTQNRTLFDSRSNGVCVHLFEVFTKGQYVYQGEVELAGEPYQERQLDKRKQERGVWVFPLRLKAGTSPMPLPERDFNKTQQRRQKKAQKLGNKELKKRAEHGGKKPSSRLVLTTQYERNPYVAELVKRRADGICDLCGKAAPFEKKDGQPFLEAHHIIWLSKGGSDTTDNAAALCPNCHRRIHSLKLAKDKKALQKRVEEHNEQ